MKRSCGARILPVLVCAALVGWVAGGCDDTRFVGVKTQVDTFVQEGDDITDLFTQGGESQVDAFTQAGFHQVDFFQQKAAAEIDIMWVVDNSASMQDEQTNLANNFSAFIQFIDTSLIDYHIGVISTDMDDPAHSGKLLGTPKVITRDTQPSPQAAFAANIQVGITGGGNEMGLYAAHEALLKALDPQDADNAGFLRETASLAVIFVSDEDDNSFGKIEYYARFFSTLKGVGNERDVILAAIVGPENPDTGCAARYGERYYGVVTGVSGTTASICETDFSGTLEQLGLTVAGLGRKFVLSKDPDPSTVVVRVDSGSGPQEIPADPTNGWRLDLAERAIYFDGVYVPPPEASIEVEYGNVEKVFRLSGHGDPTTIVVTVDEDGDGPGLPVEKVVNVDWVYDPGSNSVVFAFAYVPPLDSLIVISYSDLTRTFPLSHPAENPETISVQIDLNDGSGWRDVRKDDAVGWMYHADSNSILFQGSYVPPFAAQLKVVYSNLRWLFPLSVAAVANTITVTLDRDGAGPMGEELVPPDDPANGTDGWIYYDSAAPAPYTNAVSFENLDWPPLGGVVTITYAPGAGS